VNRSLADKDLKCKSRRDPVAAATRSEAALNKVARRTVDHRLPVSAPRRKHVFEFQMTVIPNPTQQRALQLLQSGCRVATHATAQKAPKRLNHKKTT
jgi:hypothetical protein